MDTRERWYWYHYGYVQDDNLVRPFLELPCVGGWLQRARQAKFMGIDRIAKRMKVRPAAYRKMEIGEANGTIQLKTLRKCAEAMGCELVYALRPKRRWLFSADVWWELIGVAGEKSLHHICRTMYDQRYRYMFGWSRRCSTDPSEYRRLLKDNRDIKYAPNVVQKSPHEIFWKLRKHL